MIAALLARLHAIRWTVIAALFLALIAALGVQTVRVAQGQRDYATLQTAFEKYRRTQADERAQDERQARTTEQQLYAALDRNNKDAHDKQVALTSRVADLLGQLRNRPERPAPGGAVAPAAGNPEACTGAGLYRQDSEFLAGEAAAAAAIAIERDSIWQQYEDARKKLSEGQKR